MRTRCSFKPRNNSDGFLPAGSLTHTSADIRWARLLKELLGQRARPCGRPRVSQSPI